jgi:mono/diheme cytochrome c family protein
VESSVGSSWGWRWASWRRWASASAPAHAQQAETPSPGQQAFLQYCASCHGAHGDGQGPLAEELRTAPTDLTRLREQFGSPLQTQRLLERIDGRRMARAHGSRDMPVWGQKLARNVSRGAGTEVQTRGTLLIIIDWLESIQKDS